MFLVGILSWWYGDGWRQRLLLIKGRLARSGDYFSIGQLASTLFAPYRQISAGAVAGPIGVQFRASIDRLISRIVGMFVRLSVLIFGIFVISLQAIIGAVVLMLWMIVPIFPVIGLIIFVIGWMPVW